MSNPNVRKGRDAEQAVMKLAQAMGIEAVEGRRAGRREDQGDVWLWPVGEGARVVVQVKNEPSKIRTSVGLPSWVQLQTYWKDAEDQSVRVPHCDVAVLVVKRPGSGAPSAADWFAWALTSDLVAWEAGGPGLYGGPSNVPAMWPLGALLSFLSRTGLYLEARRYGGAS